MQFVVQNHRVHLIQRVAKFSETPFAQVRMLVTNTIMALSLGVLVVMAAQDSDSWQMSLFYWVLVLNTIYSSVNGLYQAGFLGNLGRFPPRWIFILVRGNLSELPYIYVFFAGILAAVMMAWAWLEHCLLLSTLLCLAVTLLQPLLDWPV